MTDFIKRITERIGKYVYHDDDEVSDNQTPEERRQWYRERQERAFAGFFSRSGLAYDKVIYPAKDGELPDEQTHLTIACISPKLPIAPGVRRNDGTITDFRETTVNRQTILRTGVMPGLADSDRQAQFRADANEPEDKVSDDRDDDCPIEDFDLILAEKDDGHTILSPQRNYSQIKWQKHRLDELRTALELKPDIICMSEFAHPVSVDTYEEMESGLHQSDVASHLTHSRRRDHFHEAICHEIRLADYPISPFLVLGSYHCLQTRQNVCPILPRGEKREEQTVKVETTDISGSSKSYTRKLTAPVFQIKKFPARRNHERARVPNTHEIPIFETAYGRIAVMICADILDMNQNTAMIGMSLLSRPIDIILIPAFNQSDKFAQMCAELSLTANCIVAVANAEQPEPKPGSDADQLRHQRIRSDLFFRGERLRTSCERKDPDILDAEFNIAGAPKAPGSHEPDIPFAYKQVQVSYSGLDRGHMSGYVHFFRISRSYLKRVKSQLEELQRQQSPVAPMYEEIH